ncbi:MAG: SPOR domain-containing protein [Brumimicrobium sp.]|nr:SPOR domain-containing protein [Brumimicrobium sp.]
MTELSEIIGTLLLRNNCVIIPSLGGFVANTVPSKFDGDRGIISPPYKALNFNKNLNNNDGLLISAFAEFKGLSYDSASEELNALVDRIKTKLSKGERVSFQNVGSLYVNHAGNISFEQDRFFNLLLSSYGLGNVSFLPKELVEESEKEESLTSNKTKIISLKPAEIKPDLSKVQQFGSSVADKNSTPEDEKSLDAPKTSLFRKVAKYAAVAAIIPVAFYGFWIPMNTDVLQSGIIYKSDFNPFSQKENAQYEYNEDRNKLTIDEVGDIESLESLTKKLSPDTRIFSYPLDEDLYVPVKLNKSERKIESSTETVRSENMSSEKRYHLITGCFSEKENALSMVEDLKSKGYNAFIVDYNKGLHRVSAGQSENSKDLQDLRQELKSANVSSWVLRK